MGKVTHNIWPELTEANSYPKSRDYLKEKIARRLGHLRNQQLPAAEELVRLSTAKLARLRTEKAEQWQIQEEQFHLARYERDLASLETEIAEHEASAAK